MAPAATPEAGASCSTALDHGAVRRRNLFGGTTIEAGKLQLGYGSSDASITGNVNDQGTLVDDDSASDTLAGNISGAGTFVQVGTGTTVFDAAEAYTGGTTVDAGILQLGTGGSLASGGNLTINGGIFELNGHNQTIGDLAGTGGLSCWAAAG